MSTDITIIFRNINNLFIIYFHIYVLCMCIHIWRSENNWQESFLSIMWVPHIKFRLSSVTNLYFYKAYLQQISLSLLIKSIISETRSMKLLQAHMIDLLVLMYPESNKYPLIFFVQNLSHLRSQKNSDQLLVTGRDSTTTTMTHF